VRTIKVTARLVDGPADGKVLLFEEPPEFLAVGAPIARYERVPSDGEMLEYRFVGLVT
jgi:hypothetical protein